METDDFYYSVAEVLRKARAQAYRAVNFAMVEAYWNVGRMIVEEEQQGGERAEYGAFVIGELSRRLMKEFGTGFSEPSLWNMRQFYQYFPILSALRRELTWTHYKSLIRIENQRARNWYMKETAEQKWSTRALQRQINSLYYERMLLSGDRQMDMHVRIFEDKVKGEYDNPTVALILCAEKDRVIVKYSILNENQQLFAAKYQLCLPTKAELIEEIERERDNVIREVAAGYDVPGRRSLREILSVQ